MEDSFIHSDEKRRPKQFELIKKLAEEGWQVIYLTCRRGDAELLADKAEVKKVEWGRDKCL